MTPDQYLRETHLESLEAREAFVQAHAKDLVRAAEWLGQCISGGGKILICGNGGSAADSQHMAAEMVGKMIVDRRPLPAIALSTDTSNLTAIGNDFGFEHVFAKQVQALAESGDVLIAISTSGNSRNVLLAAEEARKKGCRVIGLTGGSGGKLKDSCELSLNVRLGKNSSRIQETHIFAIHSMVDLLDRYFLKERAQPSA